MSLPHLFDDTAFAAELFQRRYRRPPPWFELVPLEDLESFSWDLSERLGLSSPSIDLARVLRAASDDRKHRTPLDPAFAVDEFEPLPHAAARLHIPMDDRTALLWYMPDRRAARLRTRDVLEFHELLWRESAWLIDDEGKWLLVGEHCAAAHAWKLG